MSTSRWEGHRQPAAGEPVATRRRGRAEFAISSTSARRWSAGPGTLTSYVARLRCCQQRDQHRAPCARTRPRSPTRRSGRRAAPARSGRWSRPRRGRPGRRCRAGRADRPRRGLAAGRRCGCPRARCSPGAARLAARGSSRKTTPSASMPADPAADRRPRRSATRSSTSISTWSGHCRVTSADRTAASASTRARDRVEVDPGQRLAGRDGGRRSGPRRRQQASCPRPRRP